MLDARRGDFIVVAADRRLCAIGDFAKGEEVRLVFVLLAGGHSQPVAF